MNKKNKNHTFEIIRVIPENLVPHARTRKSKYEPIIKAVKILDKGDCLKIKISDNSVQSQIRKLLDKRIPDNHLKVKLHTGVNGISHLYHKSRTQLNKKGTYNDTGNSRNSNHFFNEETQATYF
ncbi:MAG TPA: hypothetical protein VE912_09195 [Bacteroidales bacterium]|nr:hypothetical protein [Bacteroidales bacterium]